MDRQRWAGPEAVRDATLIYRRAGNLRAVQLLLGHTKIESTVRYLGIEVDDALAIAEQVDVCNTRAERTCSAHLLLLVGADFVAKVG